MTSAEVNRVSLGCHWCRVAACFYLFQCLLSCGDSAVEVQ